MPQSLSIWWKSRLRRNDTKVLEKTSLKSCNRETVNVEQKADDKNLAVSIACAKVGSIAVRGVLNVVEAQAGASTTADMTICIVEQISKCINRLAKIAVKAARRVRDVAESTEHPTQTGLPIAINLKPVATAVSFDAHGIDIRKYIDRIDKTQRPPYHMASLAAAAIAMAEVNRAIVDVVEAYIASIAAPTTMSVPSFEKLIFAVAAAAIESARGVADAVIFMNKIPSPPYEDLKRKKISDSLEYN